MLVIFIARAFFQLPKKAEQFLRSLHQIPNTMQRPTLLIVLIVIFTFPLWIGLGAGLIGMIAGLFAGLVGLIIGLIGAIIGIFAALFDALFGWDLSDHHYTLGSTYMNGYVWFALLLVIAFIITRKNKNRA